MLRSYISAVALFSTYVLLSSPAYAGLFFVDTGPLVDAASGHTLQVTGTIEIDLMTDAVLASDLTFFHEADPGVQLPNLPTGSGVDFVLDMGMLFIAPGATTNSNLSWIDILPSGDNRQYSLSQGPQNLDTSLSVFIQTPADTDSVLVIGGGQALKVGTVAVPEPSAFMFLSLVGFVGVGTRWWRNRRTRI